MTSLKIVQYQTADDRNKGINGGQPVMVESYEEFSNHILSTPVMSVLGFYDLDGHYLTLSQVQQHFGMLPIMDDTENDRQFARHERAEY